MIDRFEPWLRRLRARADRHAWSARLLGDDTPTANDDDRVPDPRTRGVEPGLVLVQIDGLSHDEFVTALETGRMPRLARWLRRDGYRVHRLYAGVPSSTPAFQAELFYGVRHAVPGYGFVERDTRRVFRMSEREAASSVEAGLTGRGLLEGGSSYANIYAGGASQVRFSMASLGWKDFVRAARPRSLPLVVLGHSFDAVRAAAVALVELLVGLPELVDAVRRGEHLGTEIRFLQARVGVNVVLAEAITTLTVIDVARGLPIVHLDFLGYDEWAHRRGPTSLRARRELRRIDRRIGRIADAAARAERRHYEVWVLSDHGQETTEPYVEVEGRPITEAVGEILRRHGYDHDDHPEPRRGVQGQRAVMLGARVASLIVPGLGLVTRHWQPGTATSTGMGPLGHVYLPSAPSSDERDRIAAELVDDAHVPLVLAADGPDRCLAWSDRGRCTLPDDAAGVLGPDHPHLALVAEDLVALTHHRDAGDLVLSGWRLEGTPISFPHENGSHAGPGPAETDAFVFAPPDAGLTPDEGPTLRAGDVRRAALELLDGRPLRPAARWAQGSDRAVLRLLTYNVHGCVGLDGKLSPERIARVIARYEPDVVGLQELDVGRERSGGVDQATAIAEALGMVLQFHPTYEVAGERFGDAILSRLPMRLVRMGPLPAPELFPGLEPRGVVWVEVDIDGTVVSILNTHFSIHPRERRLQTEALLGPEWLGALGPDDRVLLCGDFNAGPGFPTCRSIGRRLSDVQVERDGHRPRRTWGGRAPVARIDHIFASANLEVCHVEVPSTPLTRVASDHLPLYADVAARPASAVRPAGTSDPTRFVPSEQG